MIPEIDLPAFAAARADGAVVIDVRDPQEYTGGHVPGARLLPMGMLEARAGELPRNQPIYVICQTGGRSGRAVGQLRRAGLDAVSVAGGTSGWIGQGRPVVAGPHAGTSRA